MSFSSGVFSINSTGQPVVTGTVISSTVFNAFTADIATGLSTCVLKDGTQTITGNIPMSSSKFTGLAAGTASGNSIRYEQVNGVVTTAGDILYATGAGALSRLAIGTARQQLATNSGATAPEWAASSQSLMTTLGDTLYASAANTPARLAASASVAAHATTSDVWTARETILTGAGVTFTDIADAPYVGAVAWVYQNAAHTWTDGAVFDVQGGANYTAAIGDWVRINAVTVSTFDVTIFKADGTAVVAAVVLPSYKIITFTRDISLASGTQAITGTGFTPRFVRFVMATTDNTSGRASWGEDDGTLRECVYANGGGSSFGRSSTYSIAAVNSGAPVYEGYVSAWGADGCTITWTRTGSPTGTLSVIAYFYK